MLTFLSFPNAPNAIDIIADDLGIDELIHYLNSIKRNKDHMHLTIGTELDSYPINNGTNAPFKTIMSVRMEYFQEHANAKRQ
jgi:hypothetical protein